MKSSMFLVAAACALAPLAAQGADFAKIGPLAPAAGLVAARQTLQEPALELDYKVEGAAEPGEITVDLAQDFTTVLEHDRIYICDYALARLITLDDKAHKFRNNSLYGLVDFWTNETFNRRLQRQVAGAAKASPDALDPFWTQSQLHVMDAGDGVPALARRKGKDGTIRFSYKGAEVASYTPSRRTLTVEERARLARFLKTYPQLHPIVADDIVQSGMVPARLSFATLQNGKAAATVWTLQSAVAVKAAYPLYASARPPVPELDAAPPPVGELLPVIQAALAGQAPGRRNAQDYRAATDKALADGKPFQAMLFAMEQMVQYDRAADRCDGVAGCRPMKEIGDAARGDPRSGLLANSLAPSKEQLESAIETLRGMKRDDLANPYMLDEFAANDLIDAGRDVEARALFAAAIKGNPYVPGFYKDMGDAFRASLDTATAWLFYDLGRALPGGGESKALSSVTEHEADLARQHPELF